MMNLITVLAISVFISSHAHALTVANKPVSQRDIVTKHIVQLSSFDIESSEGNQISTDSTISVNPESYAVCTGTIITNNVVMTAAHCVSQTDIEVGDFKAKITETETHLIANVSYVKSFHFQTRNMVSVIPAQVRVEPIKELDNLLSNYDFRTLFTGNDVMRTSLSGNNNMFELHPDYDFTGEESAKVYRMNDIALVHFKKGFDELGGKPVKLYVGSAEKLAEKFSRVNVVGFGNPKQNGESFLQLNKDIVPFKKSEISRVRNNEAYELIFEQNEKHGTVSGDSGGPHYIISDREIVQIGITSHGEPIKGVEVHSMATAIKPYKNWIIETVEKFGEDPNEIQWVESI